MTELTSERILSSSALVPNSGSSVGDEYFDDAAFVGDSITEGIKLYEVMTNATVVAARGINLVQCLYRRPDSVQHRETAP